MKTVVTSIWTWSLIILPFTTILTFILTLIICNIIPNNAPSDENFPQISHLGTGEAHIYFIIGFIILLPQFLIILLGRLLFLLQTQSIINRILLYIIHIIALISCVFMLMMAFVSLDDHLKIHLYSADGMFGCILLYCFLHTIVVIYLFIHRSDAPQHSNIFYPIWFIVCSFLLIVFFIIWMITGSGISEYIAAASPFLYILGFVPQFWSQARVIKPDQIEPEMAESSDEIDV